MRIIAGTARGTPLQIPKGDARPTTDRVREAVFSILGTRVDGAMVLDLFAGSGALGLEALSRGAKEVVFVEENRAACVVIETNFAKSRLMESGAHARVRCADVFRFLRSCGETFALVFADPPYQKQVEARDFASELLASAALHEIIVPDGLLVLETAGGAAKNDAPLWTALDSRAYGDTAVTFYQPNSDEGASA